MGRCSVLAVVVACGLLVGACHSSSPTEVRDGWAVYGKGVSAAAPVALGELLAEPGPWEGRTVLVEATVDEVCQVKGCWLTFRDGERTLRVSFEDYAFFVPKDAGGRRARVEGVFAVREVPLEEARHYLEDAGRHAEAAALDAPQLTCELVARGVALRVAD